MHHIQDDKHDDTQENLQQQQQQQQQGSTCVCRRAGCVVYFREVFCSKSRNVCNLRGIRQQQEVLVFWKTHVFGSVFLGSVFAKVSQIPCFCCFFKWKLRGDFQVVVLKAAKTRGFCMVDLCKVKQQASGNDHPNDCDSSNISHRPPQPPLTTAPHHRSFCMFDFRQVKQPVFSNDHHSMCDSSNIRLSVSCT